MICPHCGENNPDNAKYCVRCSATLRRGGGANTKLLVIILIAMIVIIGGIIFAIAKLSGKDDTSSSTDTTTETTETTTDTTDTTDSTDTSSTDTSSTESTDEEEETVEAARSDWFGDNDLTLSDTADSFSFTTMKNDGDTDTDEMTVTSKVTITESTENVQDGYKLVTAKFIHDISDSDGDRGIIADGAFDKYTGTFYGFSVKKPTQEDGNKADVDGFVRITDGSYHYDIFIMTSEDVNAPIVTKTITVCCPKDYDGTVFFAGYDSLELDDELQELDMSERLYTFDELPFLNDGHDTYYFQYNTSDLSGRSYWGTYDATTATETTTTEQQQGPPSR